MYYLFVELRSQYRIIFPVETTRLPPFPGSEADSGGGGEEAGHEGEADPHPAHDIAPAGLHSRHLLTQCHVVVVYQCSISNVMVNGDIEAFL